MIFNNFKRAFILFSVLILCIGCGDSDIEIPNCIDAKITTLKNAPVQNPPAEVWKWEKNGEVYYYITSDCYDQYNYLYNVNCDLVCAPDGGITGNGDGKCPEFSSEIIKTLVWKDNRK